MTRAIHMKEQHSMTKDESLNAISDAAEAVDQARVALEVAGKALHDLASAKEAEPDLAAKNAEKMARADAAKSFGRVSPPNREESAVEKAIHACQCAMIDWGEKRGKFIADARARGAMEEEVWADWMGRNRDMDEADKMRWHKDRILAAVEGRPEPSVEPRKPVTFVAFSNAFVGAANGPIGATLKDISAQLDKDGFDVTSAEGMKSVSRLLGAALQTQHLMMDGDRIVEGEDFTLPF